MKTACSIFLVALLASAALAGWTTNVWPAWQHPRDQHTQLEDLRAALMERRSALLGLTNELGLDANVWWTNDYRHFRGNADIIRSHIPALYNAGNLLDGTLATNDSFDAYYATVSGYTSTIPELAITTACIRLGMPLNICDVYSGPWRVELAGLGGHTNDLAATGRPHGYTNAHTVAGGTNFPSGRSAWYTTDYNLDNLRALIRAVQWNAHDYYALDYLAEFDVDEYSAVGGTWEQAKALAEASTNNATHSWQGIGTWGGKAGFQYEAAWMTHTWQYRANSIGSNVLGCRVDFYQWADSIQGNTNSTFDAYGYPVRENRYTLFWSTNIDAGVSAVTSPVQGSLSFPGYWVPDPGSSYYKDLGFRIGAFGEYCRVVLKWAFEYD